ncbi:MAG TPA: glycosyltransferase family 9 protein [Candidatus Omnitrophota bacterium]|nr:glycosyltransferase family 9 protein [Candidatus Omnitrophota bacterium]
MLCDKTKIENILVVSLSNIGDVILTFPVIDVLRHDFPGSKISIVIGPKAQSLLVGNPNFSQIFIYDKHQSVLGKIRFVRELQMKKFDLIVDLRNTAIPFFVPTKYRTSFKKTESMGLHMKEKHLRRLKSVYRFKNISEKKYCLSISEEDNAYIKNIIEKEIGEKFFVAIAPGAADPSKRWPKEYFAKAADELVKIKKVKIVFMGSQEDSIVAQSIGKLMKNPFVDLCGKTTLLQLAELMKYPQAIISNDSAPMHLASYLDKPVLAIFGPTNPLQYGPWSQKSIFVAREKDCLVCQNPQIKKPHECIASISFKKVLDQIDVLL